MILDIRLYIALKFATQFPDGGDSTGNLQGFFDSDWATKHDCISASGTTWFLGQDLIDWASKKQKSIALSANH